MVDKSQFISPHEDKTIIAVLTANNPAQPPLALGIVIDGDDETSLNAVGEPL